MSEKLQNMLEPAASDNSLAALLKRPEYSRRFEAVLGERAPQFASSLISIGNTMKDVEPRSIIGSAMIAAALDLPIDKNLGFAWIIPYKKDGRKLAQFQMGYKGYIQLAQRSSQYARMNATTINEEVFKGYDEVGEPELDWDAYDPAKPVWGYFFGFKLTNGFAKKAVWSKAKLLEHAKRYSQSFRSGADIWREQFDGMGTKTVISNTLRKWGPLSIQLQRALQADSAIIKDIDAEPIYPELEDAEPEKPEFSHPEKVAQEAEQQKKATKAETKTVAKTDAKVESKKEPEATKPAPEPDSAPEKPSEGKVEQPAQTPPPPETPKPANQAAPAEPAQEQPAETQAPAEPPPLTKAQEGLRDAVDALGHTFEDFVNWGKTALPFVKQKPPQSWAQIPDDRATFLAANKKGIDAGIRGWKAKK